MLQRLHEPQERVAAVHVAGTNGKGSTSLMIADIVSAAGYQVGRFSSPHLHCYEERYTINGTLISTAQLLRYLERIEEQLADWPDDDCPTEFEILTAAAFLYFSEAKVDLAVLEVGLGGLYDSTNVIQPLVAVITGVDYDHMSILGNTLEEATLQGFMELVERDAVAIWWYNRIPRPAVDLDSFELPYVHQLREFYAGINREFWVLDVTHDLGIPTLAAVCRRTDREVEDIVLGFGAHFDPNIALLRALTEVNQFMPSVTMHTSDGGTRYLFPDQGAIDWWKTATIANQPYLSPAKGMSPVKFSDYPPHDSNDLKDDVERCVEIAAQQGLEIVHAQVERDRQADG